MEATSKADKLARAARAAAQVRAYQTDPDVVALRVERIRAWVDRLVWSGIVLGLLFTMANVQHFAAGTARPPWERDGSIEWVIAWLLDPMVSLVLIGVLMGEQVINRHNVAAGPWVRAVKWVALGCTYAMNTWSAWQALNPSLILLHSVPPVIVVCATEAITDLRLHITEAVTRAYQAAASAAVAAGAVTSPALDQIRAQIADTARMGAASQTRTDGADGPRTDSEAQSRTGRTDHGRTGRSGAPAPASRAEAVRAHGGVRTGSGEGKTVDRDQVVAALAADLRDAVEAGDKWVPDYKALMNQTGFGRSWCEKVVRDARRAVSFPGESRTRTDTRTDPSADTRTDTTEAARTDARTDEAAAYSKALDRMWEEAVTGERARELIIAATKDLGKV
jgi:hypothetical protein